MPPLDHQLLFPPDAADERVALSIAVIEVAPGHVREADINSGGFFKAGYHLPQDVFLDVSDNKQFDAVHGYFFGPGSLAVNKGQGYGAAVIELFAQVIDDSGEGGDGTGFVCRGLFGFNRLLRCARNDDIRRCNDRGRRCNDSRIFGRLLRFARSDEVGRFEDDFAPFGQQWEAFNDLVILEVSTHVGAQQAGLLKVAKLAAHGVEGFTGQARSLPDVIAGIDIRQEEFQQVALGLGGDEILQSGHQ